MGKEKGGKVLVHTRDQGQREEDCIQSVRSPVSSLSKSVKMFWYCTSQDTFGWYLESGSFLSLEICVLLYRCPIQGHPRTSTPPVQCHTLH